MSSNDMNFIADLIPTSVVKVITVETVGGTVLLESNPHIVEETVPVYKRAELQATMGAEGGARFEALMKDFGVDLAKTNLTGNQLGEIGASIGMATSNKETTMVTLDVAIKDTLNRDDVAGQWFMSGDITKYLYIIGVQFKSKRAVNTYRRLIANATGPAMQIAHEYLTNKISKEELQNRSRRYNIPGVGRLIKAKPDITFTGASVQDIVNSIDSTTSGRAVTEQDLVLAGYSSIDTNGNTVYEFPTKFQFEINTATPRHAAYYVCSYLNIEQLLEDNNLTTTSVNMTLNQYANNGEWITVMRNGELGDDARISDFRDVNNVAPTHAVDLSTINVLDELASGTAQNFTTLPMYRHKYFSDIHLSVLPSRACGYFFGFSQLDFMKDNSVYGRFFDNVDESIANDVLSKCKIEEIKILRRRVKHFKQGSYARGYPNVYEPWNNSVTEDVVVSSKAKKNGKLKAAARRINVNRGGNSKSRRGRLTSGGIRELQLKTNSTTGSDFKIRHFMGKDLGVHRQTDGKYQYGVEITIRDYVPVYIGQHLATLRTHLARLKEYETFSQIPVVNRYQQAYKDPHIRNRRVGLSKNKAVPVVDIIGGVSRGNTGSQKQTQTGFYDPTINRFTRDFRRFSARKYARTRPWRNAPRVFVELLDLILNFKMTRQDKNKIQRNMTSVCNPNSGTPRGINAVIETIEIYIRIVEALLSAQPPTTNSSAASNPKTPNGGSGVTNRTVTYKTWFNNSVFDADAPPSTGASFLNMSSAGTAADIGMVSTSDYYDRAGAENLKYFTNVAVAPFPQAAIKCLSAQSVNFFESGNTIDLRTIRDYSVPGLERIQMRNDFKHVVQWVGSKRKADQTNVLTIDSVNRVGQALAPEFGVTLLSEDQYTRQFTKMNEPETYQGVSYGVLEGFSADPSILTPSAQPTVDEEKEIDYFDVFPSAMATEEWAQEQTTETVIDAISNIAAGFEAEEETMFLTRLVLNTKRDLLHSTIKNPARPEEANFSPEAVIVFLITQAVKLGGTTSDAFRAAFEQLIANVPISIQAAAASIQTSPSLRESFTQKLGREYWNHPVYNLLYQLHFMLNVRVEYLVGYRDSNLRPKYEKSIGSEIWAPLTESVLSSLHVAEGQQILCRLRPYNSEAMRISFPKALHMPIWNNVFLLVGNNDNPLSAVKRKMGYTRPSVQIIREGMKF